MSRESLIAFLDDPKTFMAGNIILPPGNVFGQTLQEGKEFVKSAPFQFSFEESGSGKLRNGEPCSMFMIGNPSQWNTASPRFSAYYCHYDTDELHQLIVGDKANLMLTPKMNGCSFGVGSATDSGARLVAHANVSRTSSDASGIKQQGKTQKKQLSEVIDNPSIIGPKHYVDADVYGTTVGVRKNGQWSFFMQTWYRPNSNQYFLRDLIDIA